MTGQHRFYSCFCGDQLFSQEEGPSPSVIMATKTGLLGQTMMFSKHYPAVFCDKST